jgi:hypothetical protein
MASAAARAPERHLRGGALCSGGKVMEQHGLCGVWRAPDAGGQQEGVLLL